MEIKVLIISSFSGTGISDRAQIAAISGLHKQGVQIHILLHKGSPQKAHFEAHKIPVTEYTIKSKIDKKARRTIQNLVKKHDFDIIHTFNNKATSNTVQAVKGLPVKIVSYRGFTGNVYWFKPTSWMNNLHPHVSRLTCVSNAVRDQVRSQLPKNKQKAVTIYKGHDIRWYQNITPTPRANLGIPDEAFLVGIVANLRTMKGIKYFINAARYLTDELNIHFLLIGRGMDSQEIQKRIAKSPMESHFHTFGFRKDVLNDVAACDVAVNSSVKGEGLSRTIIEAMSLKKPVIATSIGGNPELIINKETGLLIEPKSPKAIADAIIQYKHSPDLREKMANQGYNYIASEFTVEKTVEQTLALYRELKNELIAEN